MKIHGARTIGLGVLTGVMTTVAVLAGMDGGTGGGPGSSMVSTSADEVELSASTSETIVGPRGPRGYRGYTGYRGYRGYRGYTGAKGATGAKGPSGTIGTFQFNSAWGAATIPGNNGVSIVKPTVCSFPTYTAGTGETAMITMVATGSPSPAANDILYLDPMVSVDGGAVEQVDSTGLSAESMSDGVANVTSVKAVPLNAGHTYQFRAGFSTDGEVHIPSNGGWCQGTMMIVRSGG